MAGDESDKQEGRSGNHLGEDNAGNFGSSHGGQPCRGQHSKNQDSHSRLVQLGNLQAFPKVPYLHKKEEVEKKKRRRKNFSNQGPRYSPFRESGSISTGNSPGTVPRQKHFSWAPCFSKPYVWNLPPSCPSDRKGLGTKYSPYIQNLPDQRG